MIDGGTVIPVSAARRLAPGGFLENTLAASGFLWDPLSLDGS
jgi:hypothetical protein